MTHQSAHLEQVKCLTTTGKKKVSFCWGYCEDREKAELLSNEKNLLEDREGGESPDVNTAAVSATVLSAVDITFT